MPRTFIPSPKTFLAQVKSRIRARESSGAVSMFVFTWGQIHVLAYCIYIYICEVCIAECGYRPDDTSYTHIFYLESTNGFTAGAGKSEEVGDNMLGLQSGCSFRQNFLPSPNLEGKLQGLRFCEGLCGNVALIQGG